MQNEQNPDVNSLNIGSEPDGPSDAATVTHDSERTDVEGTHSPAIGEQRGNQSIEDPPSTELPRSEQDDSEVKRVS